MLVDSHCHLNFPDFAGDLDAVIARAKEEGVGVMQTICTDMNEFPAVLALAERYDELYCSVGVHPNDAGTTPEVSAGELVSCAQHPKVIGIGETGLDFHYEKSDRASQEASFRRHIDAARQTQLPVIIHSRDADEATVTILREEKAKGGFPGLIHCFTASHYLAENVLEMGFYISASGIASFKSAQAIRDALAIVPLDRLLVETDAPYLAPVPHRGKRNEPGFVRHTNAVLAQLKAVSEEECARATTDNFFRLFTKACRPAS